MPKKTAALPGGSFGGNVLKWRICKKKRKGQDCGEKKTPLLPRGEGGGGIGCQKRKREKKSRPLNRRGGALVENTKGEGSHLKGEKVCWSGKSESLQGKRVPAGKGAERVSEGGKETFRLFREADRCFLRNRSGGPLRAKRFNQKKEKKGEG